MGGIKEIVESGCFPGIIIGRRGSRHRKFHYNRPNVAEEMRWQMAEMERLGHLKTPEDYQQAQALVEEAESQPAEKIDYDKTGVPGFDCSG